eukprot:CAMPEP_0118663274 /NCGR_PEP_ID=MMETSP0785-20121206/17323_1 /TAXON_ID=91992 /ORGANISM="Bolidomonas pacifica, Strain CCMP 1866" /LENGTH=63 /DNA_ID=CAMNT_0006556965 /DNA_START=30 /DNA_END=218 /DNA_ORIENTATION=+
MLHMMKRGVAVIIFHIRICTTQKKPSHTLKLPIRRSSVKASVTITICVVHSKGGQGFPHPFKI